MDPLTNQQRTNIKEKVYKQMAASGITKRKAGGATSVGGILISGLEFFGGIGFLTLGILLFVGAISSSNPTLGIIPLLLFTALITVGVCHTVLIFTIEHKLKKIFNIEWSGLIVGEILKNKYPDRFNYKGLQMGPKYSNAVEDIYKLFKARHFLTQTRHNPCGNLCLATDDYNLDFGSSVMAYLVHTDNSAYGVYEFGNYIAFNIKDTELNTTLSPKSIFHKHRSAKEISQGLESTEFETRFKIDYKQDPIALRKFFQPRVIARILDDIGNEKTSKIPCIGVKNNIVIVNFSRSRSLNKNATTHKLFYIKPFTLRKNTIEFKIDKIISDVDIFFDNCSGAEKLDLKSRYSLRKK